MATKKKASPLSVFIFSGVIILCSMWFIKSCNESTPSTSKPDQGNSTEQATHYRDSVIVANRPQIIADSIKFIKENPKAGRIWHKHPDWDMIECEDISNNKIWIGMSYDMLLIERGKPQHVNTSNYGKGNQYQCCWDDFTPSCFYMGEDQIITSYN